MSPTFRNPVIRGFNPDPTVCVVPATSTTPTRYFLSTSTFEYFPGCPIYTSEDAVNWKLIGHALTRPSQLNLRTVETGAGAWASTLRYREEEKRWYLCTGVFQRYRPQSDERIFPRGFYVWTDDIYNDDAWSDPVYFDNPGFDQDLFWDDDGKVYLSTTTRIAKRDPNSKLKDFAIHLSQIDLPTGRTLTPPVCIRKSEFGLAEGSHIIKRNGFYYLFVAEGGTEAGHQEWVLRSKEGVYGPWEGQGKPLWYNGPDEEVQRTGHADVFCDAEGRWWGVFLGVRPVKVKDGDEERARWLEPQLGRETFLVKVEWVDGWPVFNGEKNVTLETEGRDDVVQDVEKKVDDVRWRADLSTEKLELGWYHKNTPLKPCYSLTARPGYLRLYGSCYDLSSPEAPSMLLQKQESYSETFHATLHFTPTKAGYEAGITVWWSQHSYATIGATGYEMQTGEFVSTIVIREPSGSGGAVVKSFPIIDNSDGIMPGLWVSGEIDLWAEASPTGYTLRLKQGRVKHSFEIKVEDLTVGPPVGASFTGTMFGIYAFGKGEPVLDDVDFEDIWIREK